MIISVLLIIGCTEDQIDNNEFDNELRDKIEDSTLNGDLSYYLLPERSELNEIPQDPKNVITPKKVELGNFLFFETGLAVDAIKSDGLGTYSCATCHNPMAGFKPNNFQGIADGGSGLGMNGDGRVRSDKYMDEEIDVQSARPLSLVNVAYVTNTMWNGMFGSTHVNEGTEHLWNEALGNHTNHEGFEGIMSSNLEGQIVHRLNISKEFCDENGYTNLFDEAFPDILESERYSQETVVRALSAFIRTITASEAPFQKYLQGDNKALSENEKKGADLFFGKADCAKCHNNPGLGSVTFHAMGVKDMYMRPSFNTSSSDFRNLGRGGFTGNQSDMYAFKTPTLYNLKDTPFYFHGSSMRSLEEVVEYKNSAKSENPNVPDSLLSGLFNPLNLSEEEVQALVSFLSFSLRDPQLDRYIPNELPSGNCFPNSDEQSKIDLGCN